jgi:hypothetical protein
MPWDVEDQSISIWVFLIIGILCFIAGNIQLLYWITNAAILATFFYWNNLRKIRKERDKNKVLED